MKHLLLGIDLGNYHTQISVYNEKKGKMESISPNPKEDEGLIRTSLFVTEDKKNWIYGKECEESCGVKLESFLETIERGEGFTIYGVEFSPEIILEKYFKWLFLLVRVQYPSAVIAKLVVSVETKNRAMEKAVYGALERLGVGRDRAYLQSHEEAYVSYALAQKKELWMQDVGLFDFNEKGLQYRQISLNRQYKPMAAYVIKKDYTEALRYEWLQNRQKKEALSYIFLKLANETLHKQSVATLYVTGVGFLDSFAAAVLPELCVGRRVFAGQNLYTRGACYKAMELAGKREAENYIFVGEDIVAYNIYLPVYKDARQDYAVLTRFGTPWQEAQQSVEVILDEEEEVKIVVNNPLKKEDRILILPLEGLPKRPPKMTRLYIRIAFLSETEFAVTIKDLGFGVFYKSSSRIWEKVIQL